MKLLVARLINVGSCAGFNIQHNYYLFLENVYEGDFFDWNEISFLMDEPRNLYMFRKIYANV